MKYIRNVEVGIDLDGVLANFAKRFSEFARDIYGEDVMPLISECEIKAWDWTKWYPITEEQVAVVWEKIQNTENFWLTLDVLDQNGLQSIIKELSNMDRLNLYFITTRSETKGMSVRNQSIQWLQTLGVINPNVIVCRKKGRISKILNLDFFIDDKTENLCDVFRHINNCHIYAYDVLHNKSCDDIFSEVNTYKRVKSVSEFVSDIKEFYCKNIKPIDIM